MRKTLCHIAAAVALLGATEAANATLHPSRCNGCSETQYYNLAYNNAVAAHQASGYQYVYDLAQNHFRKFSVEREPAGVGTYTYTVYSVTPTASELTSFATEKAAIDQNGGHTAFYGTGYQNSPGFPVPSGNTETIVYTSSYRNQIGSWVIASSGNIIIDAIQGTLLSILDMTAAIILQGDIISVTTTIVMNDGGKLTYQWVAGAASATFVSAEDANQNDIPLTIDHVPGGYIFTHDNGPAFVTYLNNKYSLNVSVCLNGTLACTGDGNHNYHCTWTTCGGIP